MTTVRQEQFIEMAIGEEHYAIGIDRIREIIRMQKMTVIPHSPPYVQGVIQLRGSLVPVISLRAWFGLADEPPTKAARIVIVKDGEESVGVMVDRVTQVAVYSNLHTPPGSGEDSKSCVKGIGQNGQHLAAILNIDALLHK